MILLDTALLNESWIPFPKVRFAVVLLSFEVFDTAASTVWH